MQACGGQGWLRRRDAVHQARRAGFLPAGGGLPRQVRQDVETCREHSHFAYQATVAGCDLCKPAEARDGSAGVK